MSAETYQKGFVKLLGLHIQMCMHGYVVACGQYLDEKIVKVEVLKRE